MLRKLQMLLAGVVLMAAPASAQISVSNYPTLQRNAPPVAEALGEPVAKTWLIWQDQQARALSLIPKRVGDIKEPELGFDSTKIPEIVRSDFDVSSLLTRTGAAGGRIPPSAAPDDVGAFRFTCQAGQVLYDDSIVFPGQPGKSHLHQYFGNTSANAFSTYASLRKTGDSTCMNKLNRSAYWIPAMLNGKGKVVRPDFISIYYKRRPDTDPKCQDQGTACVALPRGLRYIFGYDMFGNKPSSGDGYFNCQGPTSKPGKYKTITEAAVNCPSGNQLGAVINAPDCWDGKRLDSPDHRSHMAHSYYDNAGRLKCPTTHSKVIPQFTLGAWYSVDKEGAETWYMSSDDMPGMPRMAAGSTFHADWIGAWDDDVMKIWTENCINKLLNCSTGELGDGRQMTQEGAFSWSATPRLIDIPKR